MNNKLLTDCVHENGNQQSQTRSNKDASQAKFPLSGWSLKFFKSLAEGGTI